MLPYACGFAMVWPLALSRAGTILVRACHLRFVLLTS